MIEVGAEASHPEVEVVEIEVAEDVEVLVIVVSYLFYKNTGAIHSASSASCYFVYGIANKKDSGRGGSRGRGTPRGGRGGGRGGPRGGGAKGGAKYESSHSELFKRHCLERIFMKSIPRGIPLQMEVSYLSTPEPILTSQGKL